MYKSIRDAPEVRERAVRMVLEHQQEYSSQWSAIGSIASKIGCTPETLRKWVRRSESDQGPPGGVTTVDRDKFKPLERENRELKRIRIGCRHVSTETRLCLKRSSGYGTRTSKSMMPAKSGANSTGRTWKWRAARWNG